MSTETPTPPDVDHDQGAESFDPARSFRYLRGMDAGLAIMADRELLEEWAADAARVADSIGDDLGETDSEWLAAFRRAIAGRIGLDDARLAREESLSRLAEFTALDHKDGSHDWLLDVDPRDLEDLAKYVEAQRGRRQPS